MATSSLSASGFTGADGSGGSPLRDGSGPDAGQVLDVQDLFALPLTELRAAHEATLPAAFDS